MTRTCKTKCLISNQFSHLPFVVVATGMVLDNSEYRIKGTDQTSRTTSMTGISQYELNYQFTTVKSKNIRRRTFTASKNLQTQTTTGSFADGQYLHSELFDVSKRSRKYLGDWFLPVQSDSKDLRNHNTGKEKVLYLVHFQTGDTRMFICTGCTNTFLFAKVHEKNLAYFTLHSPLLRQRSLGSLCTPWSPHPRWTKWR